ncbi:MAG TPA: (S)-ureidoglycine aminohydrolase [Thermomicrobiaceae bacterium]|nr:(S)-ureidoglycine aminohydrolase [Thermomicrobiaceae bacterium]
MSQELTGVLPRGIFAHNRGVVTPMYAVMPAEGVLSSRLPGFAATTARILTAPPMGARFAQILLEIEPGGGTTAPRNDGLEHFFYLLDGRAEVGIGGTVHQLTAHGYAYVPVTHSYQIRNRGGEPSRLMWVKRPYETIDLPAPAPLVGHRDEVSRSTLDSGGRYWQYLLGQGDLAFDFEMNILGFQPGNYFPYVETHIMEHGLYMLDGQMLYQLAGDLHEVWATDFIWMASYCPQFCFCTGWGEAAYLLYKDVNRDVRFARER